jgi:hypothetical protein
MSRKQTFMLVYLILSFSLLPLITNHDHFPEEMTPLDYIANTSGEKLLMAYYIIHPGTALSAQYKFDHRNGIIVYPFNDVRIS